MTVAELRTASWQPASRGRLLLPAIVALSLVVLSGCGPSRTAGPSTASSTQEAHRPRGILKIAWPTEPEVLHAKLGAGGGANEFYWLFNSFLTYRDFSGGAHPMLARELPSRDNGSWIVNANGTMVTTYHLREQARWHDGTPLTAYDFVFAHQVYLDPDVPVRDRVPETLISRVEAGDNHTLVVHWREPYAGANHLGYQQLDPLPRHIFEPRYLSSKSTFIFGEEWTSSYVGAGPFRLERWTPGSSMIARANLDWVLGPPKLDTVEIRVIRDATTMMANLLSGEVDILNSPGVRAPEAALAREQWASRGDGYVKVWNSQIRFLAFQFRDVPNWQRAIADVRVRSAVMHATDRQGLVDVVNHGLGSIADVFLSPVEPTFAEVDRVIHKYPFDPNRAAVILAEAGWRAPRLGALVVDSSGQSLDLELWSTAGGGEQEAAIIANSWRLAGINSGIYIIPSARQRDQELRASFPSVSATARSLSPDNFVFTSVQVPTAETRWQGANRGSFQDAEVDRLQNLVLTSLEDTQRPQATIALHQRMSELVGIGPLYYSAEVIIAKSKVKGPVGEYGAQSGVSWNIFEWEVVE